MAMSIEKTLEDEQPTGRSFASVEREIFLAMAAIGKVADHTEKGQGQDPAQLREVLLGGLRSLAAAQELLLPAWREAVQHGREQQKQAGRATTKPRSKHWGKPAAKKATKATRRRVRAEKPNAMPAQVVVNDQVLAEITMKASADSERATPAKRRGRKGRCVVCDSPARAEIEAALRAGQVKPVVAQYGFGQSTLYRHKTGCMKREQSAAAAPAPAPSDGGD